MRNASALFGCAGSWAGREQGAAHREQVDSSFTEILHTETFGKSTWNCSHYYPKASQVRPFEAMGSPLSCAPPLWRLKIVPDMVIAALQSCGGQTALDCLKRLDELPTIDAPVDEHRIVER